MKSTDTALEIAINQFNIADKERKSDLIPLYAGLAIYWAQCVEKTLENMLIVKELSEKGTLTSEIVDQTFDKIENSKATMGKLVYEVKSTFSLNNEHTNQLKNVLEMRNYFVHRFFKVNSFKPYTETGQKEMIIECATFIDDCRRIDKALALYYEEYYLKAGLTEDRIGELVLQAKQEEYDREQQHKKR